MAETYATQTLAARRHALGSENTDTMTPAADNELYQASGKPDKVAEWRQKVQVSRAASHKE